SFACFVLMRVRSVTGITVPAGTTTGGIILLGSISRDFGPCRPPCASRATRTMTTVMRFPSPERYPRDRRARKEKVSQSIQGFAQFGDSFSAGTEQVFVFRSKFSHRVVQFGQQEYRIISKSPLACRSMSNDT